MTERTVNVNIPADMAEDVERIELESPGFMRLALHYATMRRGVYRHLGLRHDKAAEHVSA
jgi:hypothetical protein